MRVRYLLAIATMVMLGACTTVKKNEPQTEDQYRQSMTEADKILAERGVEPAIAKYQEVADRNPTRGTPWSVIAKLDFDQKRYGQAIVAAEEALSREPQDFVAKSVRAVAGLRVALQSLADLKSDALLAGNARSDAVALANSLRETLGEDVLFPDGKRPTRPARRVSRPAPADSAPSAAAPASTGQPASPAATAPAATPPAPAIVTPAPMTTPAPAPATQRNPNPFGGLLGK